MNAPVDPEAIARACADLMWAEDKASQGLGISLDSVAPGRATLSMTVADHMTNGHGTCHGGYIFALADSAFAFACNTYDERTVAGHCSVTFLRPGLRGDRLVAEAVERAREGRNGIYDVRVSRSGEVIAEFRGHSRTIGGTFLKRPAE
jgi:acyl-CoA thioesterase